MTINQPICRQRPHRGGSTVTELVVCAAILTSAMGVITPLLFQSGRLWQDTRRYQMAMDELSAQLDRLIHLDSNRRQQAIENLQPSEHIKLALPAATMNAEIVRDESGTRLKVHLNWDRPGDPAPISLVGWLDPMTDPSRAVPRGQTSGVPAPAGDGGGNESEGDGS